MSSRKLRRYDRPTTVPNITFKQITGHHTMYVTVGYLKQGKPFEIFITVEGSDGCEKGYLEAVGRLLSVGLQYGVPAEEFIKQLSGISCVPVSDPSKGRMVKSPVDGLALTLQEFIDASKNNPRTEESCYDAVVPEQV